MIEQEIEDNLVEDFLDKHSYTGREARAFAHGAVIDIMADSVPLGDDELSVLEEFPDLLEDVDETLDIRNNVYYNRDK